MEDDVSVSICFCFFRLLEDDLVVVVASFAAAEALASGASSAAAAVVRVRLFPVMVGLLSYPRERHALEVQQEQHDVELLSMVEL